MNKKNKYGKAILVTGFIAIVVVTICAFQKDKIVYKYYELYIVLQRPRKRRAPLSAYHPKRTD